MTDAERIVAMRRVAEEGGTWSKDDMTWILDHVEMLDQEANMAVATMEEAVDKAIERGTGGNPDLVAHRCGARKGKIFPYPTLLCSLCRPGESADLTTGALVGILWEQRRRISAADNFIHDMRGEFDSLQSKLDAANGERDSLRRRLSAKGLDYDAAQKTIEGWKAEFERVFKLAERFATEGEMEHARAEHLVKRLDAAESACMEALDSPMEYGLYQLGRQVQKEHSLGFEKVAGNIELRVAAKEARIRSVLEGARKRAVRSSTREGSPPETVAAGVANPPEVPVCNSQGSEDRQGCPTTGSIPSPSIDHFRSVAVHVLDMHRSGQYSDSWALSMLLDAFEGNPLLLGDSMDEADRHVDEVERKYQEQIDEERDAYKWGMDTWNGQPIVTLEESKNMPCPLPPESECTDDGEAESAEELIERYRAEGWDALKIFFESDGYLCELSGGYGLGYCEATAHTLCAALNKLRGKDPHG